MPRTMPGLKADAPSLCAENADRKGKTPGSFDCRAFGSGWIGLAVYALSSTKGLPVISGGTGTPISVSTVGATSARTPL